MINQPIYVVVCEQDCCATEVDLFSNKDTAIEYAKTKAMAQCPEGYDYEEHLIDGYLFFAAISHSDDISCYEVFVDAKVRGDRDE